jgi:pyridoxamine 5'-phosphate oxidase
LTDLHGTAPHDPIARFREVFKLAQERVSVDPTAMTLSTCTKDGYPSSRVVLLKDVSDEGFVFFTNYHSRKSRELQENPRAALCFYWAEIDQQIRVEGTVSKVSNRDSDAYFHSRARLSQIGAWASDQSQPLRSRQELLHRVADLEKKYEDVQVPRPSFWGGYLLNPTAMEFWINGEFRLHDRFVYRRGADDAWYVQRLNP